MTKRKRQVIRIVRLNRDYKFPPEVFIPIKTGKYLDNVTSRKGGTMPATIVIVVGEPGSGKTTLLVDKMASIIANDETKECLYISGEMSPIDNEELKDELPQLGDLDTLYLSDYDNPQESLEDALKMGWDYVILDSFANVIDRLRGCEHCKMTGPAAETWLIDLLMSHTNGKNEKGKYTAFDVIQHITKGGVYKGSTKVEHNTTAMLYVKVDKKTNERYLYYKKNRRGDINKKLYMYLLEGSLFFDEERYLLEYVEKPETEELTDMLESEGCEVKTSVQ